MDEPDRIDSLTTEVLGDELELLNVTSCSVSGHDKEIGCVVTYLPSSRHTLDNTVQSNLTQTDISSLPKKIFNANAPRKRQSAATTLTSSPHKRSVEESSAGNKKSNNKTKLRKQTNVVDKRKKSSTAALNNCQTYAFWFARKHLMTGFNVTFVKNRHMKHAPILQMHNAIIVKLACNLSRTCIA